MAKENRRENEAGLKAEEAMDIRYPPKGVPYASR